MKRIFIHSASCAMLLGLLGCVSSTAPNDISEQTQFTMAELERAKLLQTTTTEFVQYRIIFPRIVKHPEPRKLFISFLDSLPEIQLFNEINHDEQSRERKFLYFLEVYTYQQSYRNNIYSLVVELIHGFEDSSRSSTWHTFNMLLSQEKQLALSDFFQKEKYDILLNVLSDYLQEALVRQKTIKNVDLSQDVFVTQENEFLFSLFENFTLLPDSHQDIFSGMRIFINQYTMGKEEEGAYIVNIPSSVFYEYLTEDNKKIFNPKKNNFVDIEPSTYYAQYYPDLQRLE